MRMSLALRAVTSKLPSASKSSWSHTLNLPKSRFPPVPPQLTIKALEDVTNSLYQWQLSTRKDKGRFILHDGPPYANGDLHLGHAINKILKDIICRFQISQGKRVEYVPGWDCHGLPIELKALQRLPSNERNSGIQTDALQVRKLARQLAETTLEKQKEEFKSWAVLGDWQNAYMTMDKEFVQRELELFRQLVEKGPTSEEKELKRRSEYRSKELITYERMPVYFSPSSGTVLAESELEYDSNHKSTCAFIRYPLEVDLDAWADSKEDVRLDKLGALIWTTTPWTLPANKLIAVNPRLMYCIAALESSPDCHFFIAESRVEFLRVQIPHETLTILQGGIPGSRISDASTSYSEIGQESQHRKSHRIVVDADWVTDSTGTGLVHIAPAHGFDDYSLLKHTKQEDLTCYIDERAQFISDPFGNEPESEFYLKGESLFGAANEKVLAFLKSIEGTRKNQERIVLGTHEIQHKYPIDWRTKQPVVIIPKQQWFIQIQSLMENAITALGDVKFIPESGKSRLEAFITHRNHWCISRQRAWGVPIPILYARRKDNDDKDWLPLASPEVVGKMNDLIRQFPSDEWFAEGSKALSQDSKWIPQDVDFQKEWKLAKFMADHEYQTLAWDSPHVDLGELEFKLSTDTMDVWFDSGTSWTQLPSSSELGSPADVYLEGSDQHRGWFQSSLLTHVAQKGQPVAPFKTLITHGFSLDAEGRKMSKSLGNTISPNEILLGLFGQKSATRTQVSRTRGKHGDVSMSSKSKNQALGPDFLRYWIASFDYTKDVTVNQESLETASRNLKKLRVTFKWLLGVLKDYQKRATYPASPVNSLMDRIALYDLEQVSKSVHAAYIAYDFVSVTSSLRNYITDLSSGYFEHVKDRLYTGNPDERLSAQFVLHNIFMELLKMLEPITPLMIREARLSASGVEDIDIEDMSLAYEPFTANNALSTETKVDETVAESKKILFSVKELVNELQEGLRVKHGMGSGLESDVFLTAKVLSIDSASNAITANGPAIDSVANQLFSKEQEESLAASLIVSHVRVTDEIPATQMSSVSAGVWNDTRLNDTLQLVGKLEGTVLSKAQEFNRNREADQSLTGLRVLPGPNAEGKAVYLVVYATVRTPANGGKCQRCWRYQEIDEDKHLCQRCEVEVARLQAVAG